nr:nitronate monooxygenase [Paenibacillus xylanexedens]
MSWITSAELAAAVSNAGGMGTLGPHAGQHSEPLNAEEVGERLRKEIVKTKKLKDQPFGINYSLHANSWESPISRQIINLWKW